MSRLFTIRMGDRRPYFGYKFGFSLVGAVGVTFSARDVDTAVVFIDRQPAIIANGTFTIDGAAVAYVPADGVAFYPWAATDTATVRKSAFGLFHIDWGAGLQESMPSEGYERFSIAENF